MVRWREEAEKVLSIKIGGKLKEYLESGKLSEEDYSVRYFAEWLCDNVKLGE